MFGYSVMVGADSDGNEVVEATDKETGEKFIVRADDLHKAVVDAKIGVSTLKTAKTARARTRTFLPTSSRGPRIPLKCKFLIDNKLPKR